MFPIRIPASAEALAMLQALAADESTYQADIVQARKYDAGQQFVELTDRLRQFLGGDTANTGEDWRRLRLNIVRTVTAAVVERLLVTGFDSDEPGVVQDSVDAAGQAEQRVVKPIASWAWTLWQQNRMDGKQRRVHEMAVRDSEAFVLVDWDNAHRRPRFTPHQRYTDASTDGDNDGCRAFYQNDDPDQDLLFVAKRWTEIAWTAGRRQQRGRMTLYYPDRIEKYAGFPGAWAKIEDPGDGGWPIPWHHRDGSALGIPVAHFINGAGMEAREAIPAQNAINKTIVDLLAAGDMSAFRILAAFGWEPVDADGDPLIIEPGRWVGSTNANGKVQEILGADLSNISSLVDKWITWVAMVTDTPVSRFITTAQVAAEGTLKQQEGPLLSKIQNRQGELGNGWEDALIIARRLQNTFGRGGLNEDVQLSTQWESAASRDEDAELKRAEIKQKLGVPDRQIWKELGYDEAQIAAWQAEKEARRAEMAAQLSQAQNGASPPPPPAPAGAMPMLNGAERS